MGRWLSYKAEVGRSHSSCPYYIFLHKLLTVGKKKTIMYNFLYVVCLHDETLFKKYEDT